MTHCTTITDIAILYQCSWIVDQTIMTPAQIVNFPHLDIFYLRMVLLLTKLKSANCYQYSEEFNCRLFLNECNEKGRAYPVCRKFCHDFFTACGKVMHDDQSHFHNLTNFCELFPTDMCIYREVDCGKPAKPDHGIIISNGSGKWFQESVKVL